MGLEYDIEYRWNRFDSESRKQDKILQDLSNESATKFLRIRKALMELEQVSETKTRQVESSLKNQERILREIGGLHTRLLEKRDQAIQQLKAEREELEAQVNANNVIEPDDPNVAKAATIAIFDSILFAIENWSSDGDTAPDFSLACQAVLFPLVYDKVMSGDERYLLQTVPYSALEVVKRGREYVQYIRACHAAALTDTSVWKLNIDMISEWWRNDALPLIYGAREKDVWDVSSTLSLEDIIVWRDQPASRALQFPQVFDAMDLVDRFGESIRETTGLPEFTRQTIDTRLEVN